MDLLDRMAKDRTLRRDVIAEGRELVLNMIRCRIPVVAAVNGPAVGLGCSVIALSDVVYMAESAYLADPHVAVGLVAADGGPLVWPLHTSLLLAKEYAFTGDRISAARAAQIGLANHVCPDGEVFSAALAAAHKIADAAAAGRGGDQARPEPARRARGAGHHRLRAGGRDRIVRHARAAREPRPLPRAVGRSRRNTVAKRTRFAEYKDRYANFRFELSEEGILLMQCHTKGGSLVVGLEGARRDVGRVRRHRGRSGDQGPDPHRDRRELQRQLGSAPDVEAHVPRDGRPEGPLEARREGLVRPHADRERARRGSADDQRRQRPVQHPLRGSAAGRHRVGVRGRLLPGSRALPARAWCRATAST